MILLIVPLFSKLMTTRIKYLFALTIAVVLVVGLQVYIAKQTPPNFYDLSSIVQRDIEGVGIKDFAFRSGIHSVQFLDWKNNVTDPVTVSVEGDVSLDIASATEEKVFLTIADETGCRNQIVIFDRDQRTVHETSLGTCAVFLDQDGMIGFQNGMISFYTFDALDQPLTSTLLNEREVLFIDHSVHDVIQHRFAFFAGEDGPSGHVNLYVWNYQDDDLLLIDFGSFIPSAETAIRFSDEFTDVLILSEIVSQTIETSLKVP